VTGPWPKKIPVVEVTWDDCLLLTGGWETHAAAMRMRSRISQRSIGYVLADDKDGIVLAAALSQGGNVFGTQIIPRAQVRKVRRIR
jgi:hypothetical protein